MKIRIYEAIARRKETGIEVPIAYGHTENEAVKEYKLECAKNPILSLFKEGELECKIKEEIVEVVE